MPAKGRTAQLKDIFVFLPRLRILIIADLQRDTVRRQARFERRGDARSNVPTRRGSPVKDDLRRVLLNQRTNRMRVRHGRIVLELRISNQIDAVGAVRNKRVGETRDRFVAQKNRADLNAKRVRKFARFAAQLVI